MNQRRTARHASATGAVVRFASVAPFNDDDPDRLFERIERAGAPPM
jgi:hypothetical protein